MDEVRDTADPGSPWRPFVAGVRAFVGRRVPDRDADDVAQDVLLRLHRQAASLRDGERAAAWVFSIARRTIADYYRDRRRSGEVTLDDALDPAEDPAELPGFADFAGRHSVHEEVLSWLRPMADELPALYRDALVLADFEGRTQKEVAELLGLSLSGAKSRVQRARALLGEALHECCTVELGPDGRAVDFTRNDCGC
ncbi:MAG: sigma-70 family RNA polymerase sigma factor [Acidobacteria bacterium]|nr:sigma-70 family RNA polymerase sigma factor [Acidobacteriota bacterium]